MPRLGIVLLVILVSIAITLATIMVAFRIWRSKKMERLVQESILMETSMGTVEYWVKGTGPTMVMCHGGPGGYDQGKLIADVADAGYQVLCFSRPGYLRTPLVHGTVKAQARLLHALLESLNIPRIIVAGFSAGGPVALTFANMYPSKTRGLILEGALSRDYVPPDNVEGTMWEKIFLKPAIQDLMSFFMVSFTRLMPIVTLKSMLKLETTLDAPEIRRFIGHVKEHRQNLAWFKTLVSSTAPLAVRYPGLQNDLEQYKNLSPIDCSNITCPTLVIHSPQDNDATWKHAEHVIASIAHATLLETFGGHLMWVGPDADRIRTSRLNFLRDIME